MKGCLKIVGFGFLALVGLFVVVALFGGGADDSAPRATAAGSVATQPAPQFTPTEEGTKEGTRSGQVAVAATTVKDARPATATTAPVVVEPTATAVPVVEAPTAAPTVAETQAINSLGQPAQVVSIIDGDTIDVAIDGATYRVRYILMDTPERGMPYYNEATDANAALVSGQTVYLQKDVSETDRYGRLLRYVYLADGTFINTELVRQGFAQIATFPPDVTKVEEIRAAQEEARTAGRGLWAAPVPVAEAPTVAPAAAPVAAANQNGNLRAGPGTDFELAGSVVAGEPLQIVYKNLAGDWYQLGNGAWIAAFLVSGVSADLPVAPSLPTVPVVEAPPVVEQPVAQEEPDSAAFACAGGCATPPDPSCAIKGNFNGTGGDKIFHQPGGRWYDRTNVVASEGDVWFCTPDEATGAGYREAGR